MIDKRTLQDLVKEVDPTEQLDEDVEDVIRLIKKKTQIYYKNKRVIKYN